MRIRRFEFNRLVSEVAKLRQDVLHIQDLLEKPKSPENQPLATNQVAARFRKSPRTINEWVRRGWLRPIAGTKPYLFTEEEIKRLENQRKPVDAY